LDVIREHITHKEEEEDDGEISGENLGRKALRGSNKLVENR
jgi:hypothetical protein